MHRLQVLTTNDPAKIRRQIAVVRKTIDSFSFRGWYRAKRRDTSHAPPFEEFWRYLKASLRYDVPGEELCEVIWRATRQAFIHFDPHRGNQAKPASHRFLTHWSFQFRDAVREAFGKTRKTPLLKPIEHAAHSTYNGDPFRELVRKTVARLVNELTGDEATIIDRHYSAGESLADIAKGLRRRNSYVTKKHDEIIRRLRKAI